MGFPELLVFGQNLFVYESKKFTLWLTVASTFTGLVCSSIFGWTMNHTSTYVQNFNWVFGGNITLSVGIIVDRLAAMMLCCYKRKFAYPDIFTRIYEQG